MLNAETYLAVNHWVIERMIGENDPIGSSEVFCCRNGDLVAHPTVDVHQTARLIGPVVVGAGASIGAHATVVGPASIGPRTTIGERAVVCRSVLWTNCEIGADAFVDHGVVADDVRIPPRSTVHREVKMRVAPRWHLGAAPHVKAQRIQRAPAGSIADPAVP